MSRVAFALAWNKNRLHEVALPVHQTACECFGQRIEDVQVRNMFVRNTTGERSNMSIYVAGNDGLLLDNFIILMKEVIRFIDLKYPNMTSQRFWEEVIKWTEDLGFEIELKSKGCYIFEGDLPAGREMREAEKNRYKTALQLMYD